MPADSRTHLWPQALESLQRPLFARCGAPQRLDIGLVDRAIMQVGLQYLDQATLYGNAKTLPK